MTEQMTEPVLGILGAGQLSRMLWEAATRECGVRALVFADASPSSAERAGAEVVRGNLDQPEELRNFLARADRVIIESEFIPVPVLRDLLITGEGDKFTPPIESLLRVQTKLGQKQLLQNLEILTAGFSAFAHADIAATRLELASVWESQGPFVVKSSQGGYDGKGVLVVDEAADLGAPLEAFLRANATADLYREDKVYYRKEVALVGARDQTGRTFFYPLVESRQGRGVCEEVLTLEPELRTLLQGRAERHATRIMNELQWTGVLAIEFFLTEDLRLLVNELAPRVHNSAHFTLDASRRSQFEVHVRAALGEELREEDFQTRPAFAMLNLLGPENYSGPLPPLRMLVKGQLPAYDYEKGGTRPRRKIGHWNWVSDELMERPQIEAALEEMKQAWSLWLSLHAKPAGDSEGEGHS